MGEVFERNLEELQRLQRRSSGDDVGGGRKQMIRQLELVLEGEKAQLDVATKQLAAAESDSAAAAIKRSSADSDLLPSKKVKLDTTAGSTGATAAAGNADADTEPSRLVFLGDDAPKDAIAWKEKGNRQLL